MKPEAHPLDAIFAAIRERNTATDEAEANLLKYAPLLHRVMHARTGHSFRVALVIRSLWSGELCDALHSNDLEIAEAICAAIRLRAMAEGNADAALRALAEDAIEILSMTEPHP